MKTHWSTPVIENVDKQCKHINTNKMLIHECKKSNSFCYTLYWLIKYDCCRLNTDTYKSVLTTWHASQSKVKKWILCCNLFYSSINLTYIKANHHYFITFKTSTILFRKCCINLAWQQRNTKTNPCHHNINYSCCTDLYCSHYKSVCLFTLTSMLSTPLPIRTMILSVLNFSRSSFVRIIVCHMSAPTASFRTWNITVHITQSL